MVPPGSVLFAAIFVAITVAALSPLGQRLVDRALPIVDRVASRPLLAPAFCGLLSFVGSAAVAYFVMWPEPRVHDEFSYLLAADTFLHGRLTNPTHPLWQHFESFHIFHEPTYASKYPPAQGVALALGILLSGQPILGVWLSTAFMCAAVCWALRACLSPRWALLGGIAAALQVGIASSWTQTYWGGSVAALGGALVLGGGLRLAKRPSARDATLVGCGLVILANSRPVEGAIGSLAAAVFVLLAFRRQRVPLFRTLAPAVAVLALGLVAMAYYNYRVVGHWWLPPYIHHEQIYAYKPTLAFQGLRPTVTYRHAVMREYYTGAKSENEPYPTKPDLHRALTFENLEFVHKTFIGRALLLPLLVGLFAALKRDDGRMLVATLGLGVATLAFLHYFQLHYVSPIAATMFALVAIGFEWLDAWRPRGRAVGRALCVAALVTTVGSMVRDIGRVPNMHTGFGYDDTAEKRPRAIAELLASPGRDVVVVQYGPAHDVNNEWVYNDADIDGSEIVWARDMGTERNRELLDYFHDRRAWVYRRGFGADEDGLRPYPSEAD